jgi:hypothetical protein
MAKQKACRHGLAINQETSRDGPVISQKASWPRSMINQIRNWLRANSMPQDFRQHYDVISSMIFEHFHFVICKKNFAARSTVHDTKIKRTY